MRLVNKHGRAITGILQCAPAGVVVRETGLQPDVTAKQQTAEVQTKSLCSTKDSANEGHPNSHPARSRRTGIAREQPENYDA